MTPHRPTRRRDRRVAQARRPQRGQAIIWLLGTMAATAAIMYGVYDVAQVAAAKEKTVNAADTAALAGAQVEARILNLVAYNNRSEIANEVFLAQSLSMESWLGYVQTTSNNIGTVSEIIGIFVWPLEEAAGIMKEIAAMVDEGRTALSKGNDLLVKGVELTKKIFAAAQAPAMAAGAALALDASANVVSANKADFGGHQDAGVELDKSVGMTAATIAVNESRWLKFTKVYSGNARGDTRQVLIDSLDDFTVNRPGQPWFNIDLSLPLVGGPAMTKMGGTTLVGNTQWQAEDTLEVYVVPPAGCPKCSTTYTPIGWGRANADQYGKPGSVWSPRRAAQDLAFDDGISHSHSGWSGVPSVWDLQDKNPKDAAKLHLDYLVAVRRPQANTATTTTLGMGTPSGSVTGSPEMPDQLAANQLTAFGKATVYFERPQRGLAHDFTAGSLWRPDTAKEYGSLFSPYWQARLSDVTSIEKVGLMTAADINPALAPFTPGGQ